MLPDLRFVIGSVLATVVLGVATLGLVFTVKLAQENKSGRFQAIRPLAFTAPGEPQSNQAARPSDVVQQPGGPFAQIPVGGSVTAQAPAAPESETPSAAPAEDASPENDHATVDERAVVDPPLSPEGESLPSETSATPAADPTPTTTTSAAPSVAIESAVAAEQPAAESTGSIPAASAAPEQDAASLAPAVKATGKAKLKPAVPKPAVRKTAAKRTQRAQQPGRVVAPTASTGYPVVIERTPNAGARSKGGGGFPFGD